MKNIILLFRYFHLRVDEALAVGEECGEGSVDVVAQRVEALGLVLQAGVHLLQQRQHLLRQELLQGE